MRIFYKNFSAKFYLFRRLRGIIISEFLPILKAVMVMKKKILMISAFSLAMILLLCVAGESVALVGQAYAAPDNSPGDPADQNGPVKASQDYLPPLPQGKGGVIYLTFDDGPGPYTEKLLDILDKYGVKATFFVVGLYDLSLVAEMVERGHSVGNHTYTHDYSKLYASEDAFFSELYRTQDKIETVCGKRTRLVRFPGGSSNTVGQVSMIQLTRALTNAGYAYFDWNVDSKDAAGAITADEVLYNVCSAVATKDMAIVLQHDIKSYSVDAVEEIILWGLANGYTFEALTVSSPGAHHRPSH